MNKNGQKRRFYEFGKFRLYPEERLLVCDDERVPLTPRVFDVLLMLVEHHGELLTKEKLLHEVWADTFVEEGNLSRSISMLRKALGEQPNENFYIETVPKCGYRFIANVCEVGIKENYDEVKTNASIPAAHTQSVVLTDKNNEENESAEQKIFVAPVTNVKKPDELANVFTAHQVKSDDYLIALLSKSGDHLTALSTQSSGKPFPIPIKRSRRAPFVIALTFGLVIASVLFTVYYFPSRVTINSIAVLPMVNVSGDLKIDYLSDGITDSLIDKLAHATGLRVVSHASVFRYKGKETDVQAIGRELDVQAVLVGRLVQRGDEISLNIELVATHDNRHIWSKQFNQKMSNISTLQNDIALEVAKNLRLRLSDKEKTQFSKRGTHNEEAYQLYLQGRYFLNKRTGPDLQKAAEYFNQAIAEDSSYAMAYAGLADTYALFNVYDVPTSQEAFSKAKDMALKALELDDTLAEAHTSLALVTYCYYWDWPGAEREFKLAIKLNPSYATAHHWYGEFLIKTGRFEEGIAEYKEALRIDPFSSIINTDLGYNYYLARQYDEAIAQLLKTLKMYPHFRWPRYYLVDIYEQQGKVDEAKSECIQAMELSHQYDAMTLASLKKAYDTLGYQGFQRKRLEYALTHPQDLSRTAMAKIFSSLKDTDEALKVLEQAYVERESDLTYLKVEPQYDNLRSDPRFTDLLRHIGLAP